MDILKAHSAGVEAFNAGVPVYECPYLDGNEGISAENHVLALHWLDGWYNAMQLSLKQLNHNITLSIQTNVIYQGHKIQSSS